VGADCKVSWRAISSVCKIFWSPALPWIKANELSASGGTGSMLNSLKREKRRRDDRSNCLAVPAHAA